MGIGKEWNDKISRVVFISTSKQTRTRKDASMEDNIRDKLIDGNEYGLFGQGRFLHVF